VFVDWPYLKEGLLVRLVDTTHIWTSSGARAMSQTEAAAARTEAVVLQQKLLGTRAVDVGAIQLMCTVRPFVGMKRAANGAIQRAFAEESDAVQVPWQLVFPTLSNPDPRYKELPPPALKDAFPVGTPIVHIGPQHYGAQGRIVSHDAGGKTVTVAVTAGPTEAQFGRQIAAGSKLQFYPSYLVSKSLSIHPLVLSKICSSVYLQQERTDIGLRIKFSKQAMQVPEYARRVEAWNAAGSSDAQKRNNNAAAVAASAGGGAQQASNEGWEYSEKAIALLAAYKRRFPLLFELMNEEPNTFKYDAERLVQPNPSEMAAAAATGTSSLSNPVPQKTASDAIAEIDAWLKTVGITNLLLVPCSSLLMAERGIKAVEAESSRLAALRDAQPTQEVTLSQVPIFHLYRADPTVAWSPTESDLPDLGDRVLSLRSDAGAPFGVRGTVVCVHPSSRHVEVVFDKPFSSGTHLHHKCSNLRGQTLALTAMLNLSKPKVLAPKQAGAQPQQQQQQQQQIQPAAKQQKNNAQPQAQKQQQAPQKAAAQVQAGAPAATAAPQAAPIQILKRPSGAPAHAAAAAAAPAPADVDAASQQLKQLLHIGHPAMPAPIPMGPAQPVAAAAAPAAAAAAATADGDESSSDASADPMQRMLQKGKARKAKPVAGAPGTGMLVGPTVQQPPFPLAYPPHGMPPQGGMMPPQFYPPQGYMGPPPPPQHFVGGPMMMGPPPPHMMQQQQQQPPSQGPPHPQQQPPFPQQQQNQQPPPQQ
jgi:5'-3' exoribonuclease 1